MSATYSSTPRFVSNENSSVAKVPEVKDFDVSLTRAFNRLSNTKLSITPHTNYSFSSLELAQIIRVPLYLSSLITPRTLL